MSDPLGRSSKKAWKSTSDPPRRVGGRAEACEVGHEKRTAGYQWKALRKLFPLVAARSSDPASCIFAELIFVK
jgi:hypothetical protein